MRPPEALGLALSRATSAAWDARRPGMNRSIALLVALAVLDAHSFAIHNDSDRSLAPPYDLAYVAFRLGRNLVYGGSLEWMPGVPGLDAYPLPQSIAVCAVGERLYLGIKSLHPGPRHARGGVDPCRPPRNPDRKRR